MSLYILTRLFILLVTFTSTKSDLCPICSLIKSQQFSQIHLQSFTYQSDRQLLIFANDYKCPASFNESSLSIDFASDYSLWNQGFPMENVWHKTTESMDSMYVIASHKKVALNLNTNNVEYMWDIGKKVKLVSAQKKTKPEYTIVHDQVKGQTHGFIINQSKWQKQFVILTSFNLHLHCFYNLGYNTSHFVIYKFEISEELQINRQKFNNGSFDQEFYYLVRPKSNFNEAVLIGQSKKALLSSYPPLFTSLPVGFLHSSNMYLLDSASACVVVLEKMSRDLGKNLIIRRTNIPYERFFNCHLPMISSAENRCNSLDGLPPFKPPSASYNKSTVVAISVGVTLLILLLLLSLFALYFIYWKSDKKGKSRDHYIPSVELRKLREKASLNVNGNNGIEVFVVDVPNKAEQSEVNGKFLKIV